jgi:hypothetical protein
MSSKPTEKSRKGTNQVTPLVSGLIGMMAAVGTNFVLYPLDLVKVRLQGA